MYPKTTTQILLKEFLSMEKTKKKKNTYLKINKLFAPLGI